MYLWRGIGRVGTLFLGSSSKPLKIVHTWNRHSIYTILHYLYTPPSLYISIEYYSFCHLTIEKVATDNLISTNTALRQDHPPHLPVPAFVHPFTYLDFRTFTDTALRIILVHYNSNNLYSFSSIVYSLWTIQLKVDIRRDKGNKAKQTKQGSSAIVS